MLYRFIFFPLCLLFHDKLFHRHFMKQIIYEFIAMLWHENHFFIVIGTVKLSDLLHQMAVINILSCHASYHAAKTDVSIVSSQIAIL